MPKETRWTFPNLSERMGAVEVDNGDWQRLADYVIKRRIELGLTQDQIKPAGGPSTATVRNIETGTQTSYRASGLASLERVLRWAPGSIERILAGGEPLPAGQPSGPTPADAELGKYEARLVAIRDNPNRSPGLRAWARTLLGQLGELYAAEEEEGRRQAG